MNEAIYKAIAKQHGVSVEEVKREIQQAIDAAFVFPTPEALNVPRKGAVPMVDEIIAYTVQRLAEEKSGGSK